MTTFFDQIGQEHKFENTPKRIISLVPVQTELLFDLGLEESLVGITKDCIYPYQLLATKKVIGNAKKVDIKEIKLLAPDIIIANREINSAEITDQLKEICPVWVTDIQTLEDNEKMIFAFGNIFNRRIEAKNIVDKINFAKRDFTQFVSTKHCKKVAYFTCGNPYKAAGNNTFINELLTLNNFYNPYANRGEMYPEIELEKIISECNPDIVLLPTDSYPFKEEHAFELGRYTNNARTIFVNGDMFCSFGSRLIKAFEYFKAIHDKLD